MSTQFNQVVCVDHFYLDEIRLMHCMDLVSRFSAIQVVDSATLADAVAAFEACLVSYFWYPESIHVDKTFAVGDFKTYMDEVGISFRPVPPGRHSKNAIESKHNVIRSIYLRLKDAAVDRHNPRYASYKAVSISNDLYGNDTLSAFEMAKGYTKPVMCKTALSEVPDDDIDAHEKLRPRHKLALILKSKAVKEIPIQVGDLVEVYQKKQHEKSDKWSVPKPVISVDHAARSVTVPGSNNRPLSIALEDLRAAVPQESLASTVQLGIDKLDDLISELHGTGIGASCESAIEGSHTDGNSILDCLEKKFDADFSCDADNISPGVGERVSIYWPDDDQYYPGMVHSAAGDGRLNVHYDDGEKECLDMNTET